MRHLIAALSFCFAGTALAQVRSAHAKLVEKYEEPTNWANRSNFYFGARGGVAIPQGAFGLAPSVGLEMGIAPDSGFGMGLNVIYMDKQPGAPLLGIQPGLYGFGATANFRYYIQTIGPLTLYPVMSVGFLAGPDGSGRNQVLPLLNPGIGAKVRAGPFYCSFDFGLSGLTIPFVGVSVGYEGDRRSDRAEAWAQKKEELAREQAEELELQKSQPAITASPAPAS